MKIKTSWILKKFISMILSTMLILEILPVSALSGEINSTETVTPVSIITNSWSQVVTPASQTLLTTTSTPSSLRDWLVWEWNLDWNADDTSGNGNNWVASNVTYETLANGTKVANYTWNSSSYTYVSNSNINNDKTTININFNASIQPYIAWDILMTWDWYNTNFYIRQHADSHGSKLWAWIYNNGVRYGYWLWDNQNSGWNNIIFTIDKSNQKMNCRFNWIKQTEVEIWNIWNFWNNIWLWREFNGSYNFLWKIQWLKIYNRALNDSEIQALYQDWKNKLIVPESVNLADWLVGKWDLNGNANDTSGNGNNWMASNVSWIDSWRWDWKKVANFNWIDSNIIINSNLWWSSNWTMSYFWVVKFNSSNSNWMVFDFENYFDNTQFRVNIYWDTIYFWKERWCLWGITWIKYNFDLNKYYYLWVVTNNSQSYFYINWELIGSGAVYWNWTCNWWWSPWSIWSYKNSRWFINWVFWEQLFYNRALNNSEILALYNKYNNIQPSNPTFTFPELVYVGFNTEAFAGSTSEITQYNNQLITKEQKAIIDANSWDPVMLSTGEFAYDNTLLQIPGGKLPYELGIRYRNQLNYNWPVGNKFDHNYNIFLQENADSSVTFYNGKLGIFNIKNNSWTYEYIKWLKATLSKENNLYKLSFDDKSVYSFWDNLKISKIQDKYGNAMDFIYNDQKQLVQVKDGQGRLVNYTYREDSRLLQVADTSGRVAKFEYYTDTDTLGKVNDLKTITLDYNGEIKIIKFEYDSSSNITKLYDSKWQVYVENTYENNRVKTQKYGDGTITYAYTLDWDLVKKNLVTNKAWVKTEYTFDNNGNITRSETFKKDASGSSVNTFTYDTNARLIGEISPKWNGTSYKYDAKGNIIEKRLKQNMSSPDSDADDIVTKYTYDPNWDVLTTQISPNWTTITNTLDSKGNILETKTTGIKDFDGNVQELKTTNTYNTGWFLTKSIEPNGNPIVYTYSGGFLTKIAKWTGTWVINNTFTYSTGWKLIKAVDGNGYTTTMNYTNFGQLSYTKTPAGIETNFTYDTNNNKISQNILISSWVTATTLYDYDLLDQVVSATTDIDATSTVTANNKYDANGNIIETQIGTGAKTVFEYNELSKVTKKTIITNPDNADENIVTKFEYDENGNIIKKIDALNNTTTYSYDSFDRLARVTDSAGNYSTFSYDKNSNITSKVLYDSAGQIIEKTETVYDELARPIKLIKYKDPSSVDNIIISKIKYDINGKVKESYDFGGNKTSYGYDNFSRLIQVIDPAGNITKNTYDKTDKVTNTQTVDTTGKIFTTKFVYDRDYRLTQKQVLSTITGSLNTIYTYNRLNQLTRVTDSAGNYTIYTYDYRGNKIRDTEYLSGNTVSLVTKYTYDIQGNLTKVTDPKNQTTTYEYDKLNRLAKTIYPDGKFEKYEYNKLGNLISTTDPNGTIVSNTFDNLGRLTQKDILAGTGVLWVDQELYEYDAIGRLTKWITKVQSGITNEVAFSYDALGNLSQEINAGKIIDYSYDLDSNLKTVSYSGFNLSYDYDNINRLNKVSYNGNVFASYDFSWMTLDSLNYTNQTKTNYTYDDYYRIKDAITTNQISPINSYNYTYDNTSNILQDWQKTYTYDQIYRLTNYSWAIGTQEFLYDKAGNRTTAKTNNIATNYKLNNLNQYTNIRTENPTGNIQEKNYKYDNNGNLIEDEWQRYFYDYKNRLVKVENKYNSSKVEEYSYDALGRRTERKISEDTDGRTQKIIKYVYSKENIVEEQTESQGKTYHKKYINGLGIDNVLGYENEWLNITDKEYRENNLCQTRILPFKETFEEFGYAPMIARCNDLATTVSQANTTTNLYFLHKDYNGSTKQITNASWTVLITYEYDSFGNTYIKSWTWYTSINNYKGNLYDNTRLYTGREYDNETWLYFYRARYYSPVLGRFISRDPIWQSDDINLYTYVGNNGVMRVDPSGEAKKVIYNTYDFATDVSWLKSLWKWLWSSASFWVWYATWDENLKNEWINWLNEVKSDIYVEAVGVVTFKAGSTYLKYHKVQKALKATEKIENVVVNSGDDVAEEWVDIYLKYKSDWSKYQRGCANWKCELLSEAETTVQKNIKRSWGRTQEYRKTNNVTKDQDVDHLVDLQLWWKDAFENMWPLDKSVNRSLWKQIQNQIKNLPEGTKIKNFYISD